MDLTREKVINHYNRMTKENPKFSPKKMAELAIGVVAVEDNSGECAALFDRNLWEFTMPEIWEKSIKNNDTPLSKDVKLGVLEGLGGMPTVRTIKNMVNFAKEHLSSKENQAWHDAPEPFSV